MHQQVLTVSGLGSILCFSPQITLQFSHSSLCDIMQLKSALELLCNANAFFVYSRNQPFSVKPGCCHSKVSYKMAQTFSLFILTALQIQFHGKSERSLVNASDISKLTVINDLFCYVLGYIFCTWKQQFNCCEAFFKNIFKCYQKKLLFQNFFLNLQ